MDFYPSSLEKGVRSEQALKLALAEMYVQGVSTRRVSAIVEELCGHSVSSTQMSQCAAKLDTELSSWRNRPLGASPYMILDHQDGEMQFGWKPKSKAEIIEGRDTWCPLRVVGFPHERYPNSA